MALTYSVACGRSDFTQMLKKVQAGYVATITRRNEPVAYVIGKERMSALIETMEILANASAMKAIHRHRAGKFKSYRIEDIPE